MIQLNEKAVRMVPPKRFLLAKFISPAMSWQPPPKRRQNIAAVLKPAGVSACPKAMGVSAAQPMARPMSPSGVGLAKVSCLPPRSTLRIIRFGIELGPDGGRYHAVRPPGTAPARATRRAADRSVEDHVIADQVRPAPRVLVDETGARRPRKGRTSETHRVRISSA